MKRLLFILILLGPALAFSQNLAQHNWYFGQTKNGIRFNRANNIPALVTNKALPFGAGGSAVATDPATADLFFYTDGNNVYDASHKLMPNGAGLTANASGNQPVVVCAVPGQPHKYFIFTNSANFTTGGNIAVSVVDLNAFGNSVFPSPPLGVVSATKNTAIAGLTNRSEGMILVPHKNKTDFWLITQQVNSSIYSATLVNAASFTTGVFTTTTVTGLGNTTTVANFSYNPKLKKLVASPQTANVDVAIINFDNSGVAVPFALDISIPNSGTATTGNQSIYDVQWDMGGRYLYLSRTGDASIPADLLQFDYKNQTTSLTTILPSPVFRSYGLQVAPDSALYYIYQQTSGGPFLVDRFTQTDSAAAVVKRTPTPFGNTLNFAGTQFPAFLPKDSVKLFVDFTYNFKPNCQNSPTSFYPKILPNADSLQWVFGDGKDTTTWSPVHTYTTAQTFQVTLKAFYQGEEKDTTKSIVITPFAIKLQLVQDTTACRCQLPARRITPCALPDFSVTVKVQGGTPTSYLWNNGDATATLKPDSAGYYYVIVKDASGCSAYAGVNVKEFELQDQRSNIWYFGNHAGIDFNPPTGPKAINTSAMDAPAGCAIVCDRNGQTIIYTDGDKVYDKNNAVIATGIGGDTNSAQSALIIPVIGDETLYYIFTTQSINGTSNNELRYSLYDLKKDSVVIQNVLLFAKSTEHLTGNDNWLIAHEYGNNTFRAYPISMKGIGDPVYSAIGSDHSFQVTQNGQGYMKLGGKNNIAVALSDPTVSNWVELFDFTDSTGLVSNYRKIDLKTPAGQVYGVEFSPGGNKVFATIDGLPKPSFLFEYSIDSVGQTHLKKKTSVDAELGAIQLAPNGQIYIATNDATNNGSLATVAASDDTTAVSAFQLNGFKLFAGTNSRLGLPNFKQMVSNAFGGPAFTFDTPCFGDSTHFVGTARDPIDKFSWIFGDGGSSTDASPVHIYALPPGTTAPVTYRVVMRIENRCPNSKDSVVHQVTVYPPPPKPTLKPANALCVGPLVLDANTGNLPGTHYVWSTGDTTRTITVNKPAFLITVTNTDSHGCSSKANTSIGDARPKLNLGPDQTLCQGSPTPILRAGNPGATYAWTVPAGVTPSPSDSSRQIVDITSPFTTTVPQVYNVVVSIKIDPVTTCTAKDTITFIVKKQPTFTFTGVNPAGGCGTPTGSTSLTLTGPDPVLYSYTITGPGTPIPQGVDKPVSPTPIVNPAQAGAYFATVTNQVSLCATTQNVSLSDLTVTVTAATPIPTCGPIAISATTNAALPFDYTVVDSKGVQVDSKTGVGTASFSTIPLPVGSYVVTVKSSGCTATKNVDITPSGPDVVFATTIDLCSSPQTISATAGPSYSWTGPGITGGALTNTITISPGVGTFIYTVTATQGGSCPTTRTLSVNVPSPYTPSFTQTDACATSITLKAAPTGNYVYHWFLQDPTSGTFVFTSAGQQIQANATGTYELEVSDAATGCKVTTAPQVVNVNGNLTAGLLATQACADNKPFTLTATTNGTGVTYAWFLNNTIIAGAVTPTINQTSEGIYKVRISTVSCRDSAQLTVKKAPIPVGTLPPAAIICDDPDNKDPSTAKVALDPGVFTTYNWFKNELTISYTAQIYTAESAGTYSVDLTNVYGCTSSDQTVVTNDCEPVVNAPTAFRPASGTIPNQQFQVFSNFITDNFQIFIFNRWGELIFQSSDKNFRWNGTLTRNGEPTPGGTYAYVIKYVATYRPEQGIQEKHGGVVLLR